MKTRLAVAGLAVLAFCSAQPAQAGVALNTIDRQLTLMRDGAVSRTTGPIACTRGERVEIAAGVSQGSTRARAAGDWNARCTGAVQQWRVLARASGAARFEPGKARVCALARTFADGQVTDTRRWCRGVSAVVAATRGAPGSWGTSLQVELGARS